MASSDPHQGGDLSDMAATGTTVPNDAGVQNIIPSKPRPEQMAENPQFHNQFMNSADPQGATDNATDLPRQFKDMGASGEVITSTGDQMPAEIETKNLQFEGNDPQSKGSSRFAKHARQTKSDIERLQGDGAEADPAPGDEELDQDEIRDPKGI